MSIDDTVLMAYVDGELPAERRAEVEAAVAHSRELADRLAIHSRQNRTQPPVKAATGQMF